MGDACAMGSEARVTARQFQRPGGADDWRVMPASEASRREQRNRIHVDMFVPDDPAGTRIDAALAAGGRLVNAAGAPEGWTLADPEGNEVDIAVVVGREERWLAEESGA